MEKVDGLTFDLLNLLKQYHSNIFEILKDNPQLEYFYALSDLRENLLEWFEFHPEAELLQVGSDFGALTGLYSRRVKHVTVIDETEEKFLVSRERHKDADNINYFAGTMELLQREGKCFDYIVFAGSLKRPFKEQLDSAKRMLKAGGSIIIAIENKLGLKFFAGVQEEENAITKKELDELLKEENQAECFYPMPDYKTTYSVFSDKYLPKKGDLSNTLIAYDYPKFLGINVGEWYDTVCEDGQFAQYANSFLVVINR